MGYIKKEFIEVAKGRSKDLALQLLTLSKFAVVGVMTEYDFNAVCDFLKQIGAKFNTKGKKLIWLEVLPEILQNLFLNKKTKNKNGKVKKL